MFLTKAAVGGEAEVALATLAQRKAADPRVKSLAERIGTDHKKANSELRAIIVAKKITVPGGDHHTKDIKEFETAAKSTDAAVKEFAEKTLPTWREHLKMAQDARTGAGKPSSVPNTGAAPAVAPSSR
jgi:putative membrane protein